MTSAGIFINGHRVALAAYDTGHIEGAVKLGMRRELDAIANDAERQAAFDAAVQAAYDRGKGISMAEYCGLMITPTRVSQPACTNEVTTEPIDGSEKRIAASTRASTLPSLR